MSVANFLMGRSVLVEAKMNKESKLLNACTRLDNIMGVLNSESYNCGTLPSQIPVWKTEHEITAEINSLLLTEI